MTILRDSTIIERELVEIWFASYAKERNLELPENFLEHLNKAEEVSAMFATTLDKMVQDSILKGIIKGKLEGKLEGLTSVVKSMHSFGDSMDFISQRTNLTIQEIESIIKDPE